MGSGMVSAQFHFGLKSSASPLDPLAARTWIHWKKQTVDSGRDTGVGTGGTPKLNHTQPITRPLSILMHVGHSYGNIGVRDELALSNFVCTSIVIVKDTMQDRPVLIEAAVKHRSKATLNKEPIAVCCTSGLVFY